MLRSMRMIKVDQSMNLRGPGMIATETAVRVATVLFVTSCVSGVYT